MEIGTTSYESELAAFLKMYNPGERQLADLKRQCPDAKEQLEILRLMHATENPGAPQHNALH
jgi:hypothetical protein